MTTELTVENVYLDAQSFERVILGGELQIDIFKRQLCRHLIRNSQVSARCWIDCGK